MFGSWKVMPVQSEGFWPVTKLDVSCFGSWNCWGGHCKALSEAGMMIVQQLCL